jgi:hypothetical protein
MLKQKNFRIFQYHFFQSLNDKTILLTLESNSEQVK